MQEEVSYWDVQKSVITKKRISEDIIKKQFTPFMALNWLSADPKTCYETNELNTAIGLNTIPLINEYKFIKNVVRLPKNKYLPMDKNDKHWNIIISAIANYYNVGKVTANEYIKLMGGSRLISLLERIGQIHNNYTTDKNILSVRDALKKKKAEIKKIKGIK
jgi:hypothetical protein